MKPKFFLAKSIASLLATGVALTSALHALPQGEQVGAGTAVFERSGAVLNIRTSDRAIINYSSFNIGAGERVNFIQPGTQSITLNRVTEPNPTHIFGTLQANGRIVLANPYGIFFESGSVINVGGLIAGAGHIADSDFLAGRINFSSLTGSVENRGNIIAVDDVGLYGARVSNEGVITSLKGAVTLGAGGSVYVGERDGNIFVGTAAIPKARVVSKPGVSNSGTITAPKATLVAGDMVGMAVAQSGSIISGDITISAGTAGVAKVSGTLDASNRAAGQRGGKVQITGRKVSVRGAKIDASGDAGGGEILVGGDFRGAGTVQRAGKTRVDSTSSLIADAITSGDGGKVVVWSDKATSFYGTISARGGAQGGDGGQAEVSGKLTLDFGGSVNLLAPAGRTGSLLLDPSVINIQAAGADGVNASGGDPNTIVGTANVSILTVATLQAALGAANVIVDATGGLGAAPLPAVNVLDAVTWANTNTLTLVGGSGGVNIQAPITAALGTLVLTASVPVTQTAAGAISVANLAASAAAGGVNLTAAANTVTTFAASAPGSTVGFNNTGAFTVGSVGAIDGITATNGVSLRAGGTISQTAAGFISAGVGGLAAVTTSGSIALATAANTTTNVAFNSAADVSYSAATDVMATGVIPIGSLAAVNGVTAAGTTTLTTTTALGVIVQDQPISTSTLLIGQTGTGATTLTNAGNTIGTFSVSVAHGTGAITVNDSAGGLTVNAITSAGTISLTTAGGPLTVAGALDTSAANKSIGLISTDDAIVINAPVSTGTLGLSLRSGGAGSITATAAAISSGTLTLETGAAGGATITTAAHNVGTVQTAVAGVGSGGLDFRQTRAAGTTAGAITSAGNVTVNDGAGPVTVSTTIDTSSGGGNVNLTASANLLAVNGQIKAGTGSVALIAQQSITQANAGAGISAASLRGQSGVAGNVTLNPTGVAATDVNAVATVAGFATGGDFLFRNSTGFDVGTVNVTNGILANAPGASVTLRANSGAITQSQAIGTPTLNIITNNGDALNNAVTNSVEALGTISLGTGAFSFRDDAPAGLAIPAGVTANGGIDVTNTTGDITTSAALATTSAGSDIRLAATSAGAAITLGGGITAANNVALTSDFGLDTGANLVEGTAGSVSLTSISAGVNVGAGGVTAGTTLSISAGGSGGISQSLLGTLTAPGGITLTTAGGTIGSLLVPMHFAAGQTGVVATTVGGDVFLIDTLGALDVTSVTTTGGAGFAAGNVAITTTAGALTVGTVTATGGAGVSGSNGPAGGTVALTSSAALTIGAGGIDTSGADAVVAPGDHDGGSAGSVLLSAGAGAQTITLNGDLIAAGGNRDGGAASFGANGLVTLTGDVVTGGDRTISGAAATFTGRLSPGGDAGAASLTVNGDFIFAATGSLFVTLNGTTPGSGFDQIVVNGSPNSASSAITLASVAFSGTAPFSYSAAPADTLDIFSNSGGNAVSGIFSGLPDGTVTTVDGQRFQISYAAGGDNVRLTRLPTVFIWDGGGANDNWTTDANWDVNTAHPAAGDIVHFAGAVRLTPNNNLAGGTIIDSITFDGGASAFTLGGNSVELVNGVANNSVSTQTVNMALAIPTAQTFDAASGSLTVNGVISGAGALTKTGPFTLLLTGANTYSGGTTIGAGTLQLGNGGAAGSLDGAGAITNNGAIVFNRSDTITQGVDFGTIGGSGSVTQAGGGTTIFTATNTYAGSTTISAGTLQLGDGGTSGSISGAGAITDNGALVFNRSDALVQGTDFGTIAGTGTVTQAGSGRTTLNAVNTFAGATTVSSGVLAVGSDANLGTAPGAATPGHLDIGGGTLEAIGSFTLSANRGIALGGGGTIQVAPTATLSYGGIIAGAGALTKTGGGVLVLSGANTYGGGTVIGAGTLQLGIGGATGSILGDVTDNGALVFNRSNAVNFTGTVSGTGDLTVAQSGGITFSGIVDVGNIAILDTAAGQTVSFTNDVNAASMSAGAGTGAYNVSLTGAQTTVAGVTNFSNTGTLRLGDGGDTFLFTGGVVATAQTGAVAGILLNGNVAAAGTGVITLGDADTGVTVAGNSAVGGTSTGLISMGNALLLDGVTLSVGTIDPVTPINLSAVSGTAGGAASNLVIGTAGAVNVSGAVGTDIGTVTVTNSGGATFAGTFVADTVNLVDTAGTIAFQGNTTITGALNTAVRPYSVSLTGALNAIAGATTFNNTGAVAIGDQVSDSSAFPGGLNTAAGPVTTLLGGSISTVNAPMQFSRAALTANATLNSGSGGVTFADALDGPGGLVVFSSGVTAFNGAVGVGPALAHLYTTGGGTTTLPSYVVTTGSQLYIEPVTLVSNTFVGSSGGGDIGFFSTVSGAGRNLTVTTAGDALFGGNVTVNSLVPAVQGTTFVVGSPHTEIVVPTPLNFTGPVAIYGDVLIGTVRTGSTSQLVNTGDPLTFSQTVNGPGTLTAVAGGFLTFAAPVGFGTALQSLVAAAPIIRLAGTRTSGLLSANATPAATTDGSDGLLSLTGNSYTSLGGSVLFNPTDRTTASKHATILSLGGNVSISAAGTFFMGHEQKMLVNAGALSIVAGGAVLGDLAAFTSLDVTASTVLLQGRVAGGFFNENRQDRGLGFVSPRIRFNTSSMGFVSGTTPVAVFSSRDSIASVPRISGVSLEFDANLANQFGKSDLKLNSFTLLPELPYVTYGTIQPIASGTFVTDPADSRVVFIFEIPKLVELPEDTFLSKSDREILAKMGIYPREATDDENITVSLRRGVFRQPIEGKAKMDDPEYKVVVNRLTTEEVQFIIKAYTALAGEKFENLKKIATNLAEQVGKFQKATPGALGLEGFGKWLLTQRGADKGAEELVQSLDKLSSVFLELSRIGLTKKEVSICKLKICDELREFLPNIEVWDVVPLVEGAGPQPPQAPRPAVTLPPPGATPAAPASPAAPSLQGPLPLPPPPETAVSPPAAGAAPIPDPATPKVQ